MTPVRPCWPIHLSVTFIRAPKPSAEPLASCTARELEGRDGSEQSAGQRQHGAEQHTRRERGNGSRDHAQGQHAVERDEHDRSCRAGGVDAGS